jgi:hypothetical protein
VPHTPPGLHCRVVVSSYQLVPSSLEGKHPILISDVIACIPYNHVHIAYKYVWAICNQLFTGCVSKTSYSKTCRTDLDCIGFLFKSISVSWHEGLRNRKRNVSSVVTYHAWGDMC